MLKRTFLVLLLSCAALGSQAFAQLYDENFDYSAGQLTSSGGGANVSGGNWVGFSGTGFYIQVTSGSLSYPSYLSSGIGNKIEITSTGSSAEDVYRQFNSQGPGSSVYVSFLLSVHDTAGLNANSSTTGDYFFALLPSTSTSAYFDRLMIRKGSAGSTYQLGLRHSTSNAAAAWDTTNLDTSTTYLVVVKYELVPGSTNDVGSLWVNPAISDVEPVPDASQISATGSEPANIARTAIRQGGLTTPSASIDGIRVGLTWAGIMMNEPVSLFSTKSLVYGNVNVNTSSTDTVTLYNIGAAALNLTGVTSSDAAFSVVPTTGSVAPLDSLKFAVTFTPTATGDMSSAIVFASNTTAGFDTVQATGTGVQAGFSVHPTSIAFGPVFKDSISTDVLMVTNASSAVPLVIDSVISYNPVFTISPTNATVPASDSAQFVVTFHPVAVGSQSGDIVFFHNAPSLHDTVRVNGIGILHAPIFSSTPASLAFGGLLVGNSKVDSIVVKNTGYDSLFITGVSATDTQFVVTPTEARLDTNASAKFYVTFKSAVAGPVSAYLVFTDNTPKVEDSVAVTGTGLTVITIAEARQDTNHDYQPDRAGQTVTIEGVVNSINVQGSNGYFAYYIQDTTGGIEIFSYNSGPNMNPGYRVRVTGAIQFYRGTTEITPANIPTDVVILDSGNVLTPIPLTIGQFKANGELYEGRLIRLKVVAPMFTDASWPAAGAAANLNIWDGKDTLTLRVESETDIPGSAFPDFPVTLTGTATQFTALTPANTGYQITPNYASDFVHINAPPVANFHLAGPANASSVYLTDTAQVVKFTWHPSFDFNNDPLKYSFAPVGFSTVLADGNGSDTVATLKGRDLLAYLGAADSVALRWTVQVADTTNPAVASIDTFQVSLVRNGIQGVGGEQAIPKVYAIDQNYPNPFNPSTTIHYALPRASRVVLKVYSLLGEEVATLVDEVQGAHNYTIVWNGTSSTGQHVASGVYFYRVIADPVDGGNPFSKVLKMIYLK